MALTAEGGHAVASLHGAVTNAHASESDAVVSSSQLGLLLLSGDLRLASVQCAGNSTATRRFLVKFRRVHRVVNRVAPRLTAAIRPRVRPSLTPPDIPLRAKVRLKHYRLRKTVIE